MKSPLHLFEATGIELEYMIVDRETLSVRPIADELLKQAGGGYDLEVELGDVAWSNELALHVIEMKANGPVKTLSGLAANFQDHVGKIQSILSGFGARLLPTAMHPWMQPDRELKLWPHENDVIYQTFDRIFDCRGHGWSNLQSMHINLPFQGDDEFGRLHAAIRLILPILPALAASSPFVEGKATGFCDSRVDVYRTNARRVPSVSGVVIPEPVFTRVDYEEKLLQKIYADMAALDPEGTLRHEWVNARGAIARFERMAIEIRVLDLQECPRADIAIAHLVVSALKRIVAEAFGSYAEQKAFGENELLPLLVATVKDGDEAVLDHPKYLAALGYRKPGPARARDVWQHLATEVASDAGSAEWRAALDIILDQGCLARRILAKAGKSPRRDQLEAVYSELACCLDQGELLRA